MHLINPEPKLPDQIRAVFAHWQHYHKQAFPRVHGDLPEWRKIRDRLTKDKYTVAQLCRAIDGIHVSPWHTGENPGGKKYLHLDLCMRDSKHVDMFLEQMAEHENHTPVLSEKTRRTVRAAMSWAARKREAGGPPVAGHIEQ